MINRRSIARIAAAALVASGLFAATSSAWLASSGGAQLDMTNRTETVAIASNSVAWIPVGGASVTVTVPAGTTQLFNARFTAESKCYGTGSGICRARMVAWNTANPSGTEMAPISGVDFAFDTDVPGAADVDGAEAKSMERSIRLSAGTYRIVAERSVNNVATTSVLDDWHFAVERSA